MKYPFYALLGACILVTGCNHKTVVTKDNPEGTFCDDNNLCKTGLSCVDKICRRLCTNDNECDKTQECRNHYCVDSTDVQCATDDNCNTPGPCQQAEDATCVAGKCHYVAKNIGDSCDDNNICTENDVCNTQGQCQGTAVICNNPPSAQCINNDNILRTYSTTGTCQTKDNLGCVYNYTDQECANCTVDCLNFCMDVHCADSTGSCLGQLCDPHSTNDPPCTIQYKAIGTPCDRLEGSGLLDGYCENNKCYECTADSQCTDFPTWHECFVGKCQDHTCQYLPKEELTLCGNRCIDGYRYGNGDCSTDGQTCSAAPTFCKGFRCDANHIDCLTTCKNSDDCIDGYFCNAKNVCQDASSTDGLPSGASCTEDDECLSKLCIAIGFNRECATICKTDGDCRDNLVCGKIKPREADSIAVCQSPTQKGCASCTTDNDCQEYGTLCADLGGEKVCLGPCSTDSSCPLGFTCQDVTADNGLQVKQCLPESGSCACTPGISGQERQCFNQEPDVGICFGRERCNGTVWEGCDAAIPATEICDGIDNNCDGQTDILPNGTMITRPCCLGYDDNYEDCPTHCSGLSYCQNGTFGNCTGPRPAVVDNPCDGIDNNCNGLIDETPCDPGSNKTGVYKWGCSGKTCMQWQCQWPYFDVDGDPANGCEAIDDYLYVNGNSYHNNTVKAARNLGMINTSGTSEIHYCSGILPRDNRINYYNSTIPDISSNEGNDYFYFKYNKDAFFSQINLKLKVRFDNGTNRNSSLVKVCLSTPQSDPSAETVFDYCKTASMSSTAATADIIFDHDDNGNYFSSADSYYFIQVSSFKSTAYSPKFTGKYHLQLIEDKMDNDITGTNPACK